MGLFGRKEGMTVTMMKEEIERIKRLQKMVEDIGRSSPKAEKALATLIGATLYASNMAINELLVEFKKAVVEKTTDDILPYKKLEEVARRCHEKQISFNGKVEERVEQKMAFGKTREEAIMETMEEFKENQQN